MRFAGLLAAVMLSGPEIAPSWFFGAMDKSAVTVKALSDTTPPCWDFDIAAEAQMIRTAPSWDFSVTTIEVPAVPISLAAWTFDTEAVCNKDCNCQGGKDCGTGCVCCGKVIAKSCPDCTADDYAAAVAKARKDGKHVYLFVGDESERVKQACEYAKAKGMVFAYEPRPVRLSDGETYRPGVHEFATKDEPVQAVDESRIGVGPQWVVPTFGGCPNGQCGRR